MSLSEGYRFTHKNIQLMGYSVAGLSTSFVYPDADVCFDVAQGLPFQLPITNVLLTHGHMDHAAGLPYLIGMKSMTNQAVPQVYMPHSLVQPMREMMRIWSEIDEHEHRFQFEGLGPNEERPLKGAYFFRTFPTFHRLPSHGYTIYEKKKRLKREFQGLQAEELANLRTRGIALEEHYSDALVSFTGDSKIEFLNSDEVKNSRVLLMEVTYWDDKKSVHNAREWGHIHFDELVPILGELKNEKIVLIHASARYTTKYLREILDARVPEHIKDRVVLFTRPM